MGPISCQKGVVKTGKIVFDKKGPAGVFSVRFSHLISSPPVSAGFVFLYCTYCCTCCSMGFSDSMRTDRLDQFVCKLLDQYYIQLSTLTKITKYVYFHFLLLIAATVCGSVDDKVLESHLHCTRIQSVLYMLRRQRNSGRPRLLLHSVHAPPLSALAFGDDHHRSGRPPCMH